MVTVIAQVQAECGSIHKNYCCVKNKIAFVRKYSRLAENVVHHLATFIHSQAKITKETKIDKEKGNKKVCQSVTYSIL